MKSDRRAPRLSESDASAGSLVLAAQSWPSPAIVFDRDGVILAASPLAGVQAGMRAPFDVETDSRPYSAWDRAGRHWTVSADVDGERLAISDARQKSDAESRFTAAVSHEIRTPLNGILGLAALLEEGELSPAHREYAGAIRKSGARLLDLLNNVLDYSRIEAGDLPLENVAFSPEDLVQDVAELLSTRAHSAGLDLAAIVDPNLAPRLMGDPGRLRQILFNLAGNAIKFTETGGVLIEIARGPQGVGVSLIVRDTGLGIPSEANARLFDAFSQVRATDSQRDGGVGLGLAIVARLTQAMNGTAHVMSAAGQGAMFRIDLPLLDAPGVVDAVPRLEELGVTVAVQLPPPSTLACVAALGAHSARLTQGAPSAVGAFDVAIVDAALPPARIEATAQSGPTLVVLRPEDRSSIPRFRQMGCVGYLIRPLRAASVLERVRVALTGGVDASADVDPVECGPGEAGRVLIADDNGVNTLLASRALKAAGYAVDLAGTGAEALERASQTTYSMIFMDIRMPVLDGIEATRRIRKLPGAAGRTPIVAITADIDPELEGRAQAVGVSQLAAKPIDPPTLRALAARWSKSQVSPE